MKFKKFFAVCTTALLALGLAGVGAVSASATNSNQPDYWETQTGEVCADVGYSTENSAANPYVLPALDETLVYSKVIVKAGSTGKSVTNENAVYTTDLTPGATFVHPEKGSISHVIVCSTPPPPSCLLETAVSYTYDATNNSGVITVTGDADAELCRKLYVVAASWTFDGLTNFPQTLDKWNPANTGNAIQKVGTYPFAAYVNCGQGDIYSSWGVPVPTEKNGTLTGSGQPYAEHFLHQDVSPHTPNTWTVDTPSLCVVETVPVVTFTDVCGTADDAIIGGTDTTSIDYTITDSRVAGVGLVTVTAAPQPDYTFADGAYTGPWSHTFTNEPCPTVIEVVPVVTFTDVCGTADDLVSTPDDTGALDYTETWNQAHTSVTVTVVAIGNNTIKDGVTTSWTFDFTDVSCPYTVLIGDPLATPQICANNLITAGHLWVDFGESPGFLNANLRNQVNYQIVGPGYNFTATDEYNELPPGDYVVTVTAKSGFVLNPSVQSVWPLTIGTSGDCQLVDHALLTATASMKNLSCVGGGSYTLVNTPGILWYVNNSTTATPAGTYTVATASTVTVTADIADKVNNGWENGQPAPWAFTFTDPADCDLPTLAFTGTSGGNLGLLLAGGFLLFGGAIIAFERRFRFDAR